MAKFYGHLTPKLQSKKEERRLESFKSNYSCGTYQRYEWKNQREEPRGFQGAGFSSIKKSSTVK